MGAVLFEDNLVDVTGGLVFSRVQKKLLGVRYTADKRVSQWVDAPSARLQRQIDATFPGKENFIALPAEFEDRVLIFSQSDVDSGTYYLMDRKKPSIEALVKTREWLDPKTMSERRFITYKARDGRTIPAYVTIPAGSNGKNLPLVVNIHGGPWARVFGWTSDWGRPEAQFFASRGYAVLEPEPRGSTGFGKSHYESSFRQWGQTMQDDITDGALHLVKEGIVDKGRMCLHGGSYGGYATLMGLAKDPDLWKCGTPFVAVTDLTLFQSAVYSDLASQTNFMQADFPKMIGDSSETREMFRSYSPAQLAKNIKAPVFLSMGSDDVRVPQAHGDLMRSNLEAAGKKVEYVVYPGEGHGYNKPENVYDFYRRLEKFYAQHLK
jgi:dipeptidyl aminopeptidase/acylaminoacyl peptidase